MLKGGSGADFMNVYSATKFVQLLSAHWWRRELAGQCDVVACSPGLIPGTGLGRNSGLQLSMDMPDAKPVATGTLFSLRRKVTVGTPKALTCLLRSTKHPCCLHQIRFP